MERTASTLALGLVLAAALSWLFGSVVEAVFVFLGDPTTYAGNVGGLAALVAFLLFCVYVLYRVIGGG